MDDFCTFIHIDLLLATPRTFQPGTAMTSSKTTPLSIYPHPRLAIREDDFPAWLGNAKPGSRVEYYRGYLVIDRTRGLSPFDEKFRHERNAIADRALALAEEGLVILD